ncbi:MAG: hypothetical protein HQK54_18400, partial [Oligoflexales bacterium]|nr:hypothetical protein [Oligoflexales bacterium]
MEESQSPGFKDQHPALIPVERTTSRTVSEAAYEKVTPESLANSIKSRNYIEEMVTPLDSRELDPVLREELIRNTESFIKKLDDNSGVRDTLIRELDRTCKGRAPSPAGAKSLIEYEGLLDRMAQKLEGADGRTLNLLADMFRYTVYQETLDELCEKLSENLKGLDSQGFFQISGFAKVFETGIGGSLSGNRISKISDTGEILFITEKGAGLAVSLGDAYLGKVKISGGKGEVSIRGYSALCQAASDLARQRIDGYLKEKYPHAFKEMNP